MSIHACENTVRGNMNARSTITRNVIYGTAADIRTWQSMFECCGHEKSRQRQLNTTKGLTGLMSTPKSGGKNPRTALQNGSVGLQIVIRANEPHQAHFVR